MMNTRFRKNYGPTVPEKRSLLHLHNNHYDALRLHSVGPFSLPLNALKLHRSRQFHPLQLESLAGVVDLVKIECVAVDRSLPHVGFISLRAWNCSTDQTSLRLVSLPHGELLLPG